MVNVHSALGNLKVKPYPDVSIPPRERRKNASVGDRDRDPRAVYPRVARDDVSKPHRKRRKQALVGDRERNPRADPDSAPSNYRVRFAQQRCAPFFQDQKCGSEPLPPGSL
jgi:hypothetical protein